MCARERLRACVRAYVLCMCLRVVVLFCVLLLLFSEFICLFFSSFFRCGGRVVYVCARACVCVCMCCGGVAVYLIVSFCVQVNELRWCGLLHRTGDDARIR